MNVVMTEGGRFVEVQGTAEGLAFTRGELDEMLGAGRGGHRRDRRPAAELVGRRRPRAAVRLLLAPPATPTRSRRSARSSAPGFDVEAVDPGVEETGRHVRGQRVAQGAGRARRHRRARRRRRLRHRGRRPRRRARHPLGALGGRATRSGSCCASSPACRAERTGCRYVCAAAVARPDGTEAVVRGTWTARSRRPRGATAGSATTRSSCPVEGDGRTFGEMTADEKHAISHRARAFRALVALATSPVGRRATRRRPRRRRRRAGARARRRWGRRGRAAPAPCSPTGTAPPVAPAERDVLVGHEPAVADVDDGRVAVVHAEALEPAVEHAPPARWRRSPCTTGRARARTRARAARTRCPSGSSCRPGARWPSRSCSTCRCRRPRRHRRRRRPSAPQQRLAGRRPWRPCPRARA